jgi:lysophospholipid acyltransferase (LPLAT)-like uncharacterized protein
MSSQPKRKSGIVIPHKVNWYKALGIWALYIFMRLIMSTWRRKWVTRPIPPPIPGPVIIAMWHNRLSLSALSWDAFAQALWPSTGMCALISASKDGALMTSFVEKFGVHVVRGSSSRRGAQALLEASTWLEKKYSIAITPDGPRGPRYKAKPGAIQLAMVTGAPIIPVSYYIHHKYCFASWDRFQFPLPFSRCDMRFGPPIRVPRDATAEQQEQLRQQLEKALMDLTTD